jgi:hypothetical protein
MLLASGEHFFVGHKFLDVNFRSLGMFLCFKYFFNLFLLEKYRNVFGANYSGGNVV